MPRNKTAKRSAKRNTIITNRALATAQKMEKDFIEAPAKLAAPLDKEIASLKQKENKVKTALHKIKAQLKNWESRIKAATKAKGTSAGKKQLSVAKKAYRETIQTQAELNKELKLTLQLLETATNKQAKFYALSKLLKQFDKEWARNARKAKASKKVKAKAKRQTVKAKTKAKPVMIEIEQQSHFEPVEVTTIGSEVRFDEATEITS
jgi:hypothetical protein